MAAFRHGTTDVILVQTMKPHTTENQVRLFNNYECPLFIVVPYVVATPTSPGLKAASFVHHCDNTCTGHHNYQKPIFALTRELKEELKINVIKSIFLDDYVFDYLELKKKIHLFFYAILQYDNQIQNIIHRDLKWIEIQELSDYDFLEGDNIIIQKLINNEFKFN